MAPPVPAAGDAAGADAPGLDGLAAQLRAAGLEPRLGAPLARLGFWRIGGPADLFVEVPHDAGLQAVLGGAQAAGLPVTVLGNGSNLLVADAGVRGVCLRLTGDFRRSAPVADGSVWRVGGGLLNTVLLARLKKAGAGGLGCLAGVPGTVGGAVRMNAGWSLGELSDRLEQIELALPDGSRVIRPASDLDLGYRRARLPVGALVTQAWVRVEIDPDAVAAEAERVRRYLARRKATQPLHAPSCGSVFKNPEGDHAGRLIEAVGLKGRRVGGAQISDRHANFIVNTGDASASDVYRLIRLARRLVWLREQVTLAPEVHAIGAWPQGAWPLPSPAEELPHDEPHS